MKKNLILAISDFSYGGAEVMFSLITSNLDLNKFDITVISKGSKRDTDMEKRITEKGIKIEYIDIGKGQPLKTLIKINKLLKKIKPDIIHTHLSICLYFTPYILFNKVKAFHTLHNLPDKEIPKTHRIIMKFMYKIGKATPVAISNIIKNEIKEFYNYKKSIPVIYNPVDVSKYSLNKTKEQKDKLVFVNVARLVEQKNHKLLIDVFAQALKENDNIELLIAGEGCLKSELQNMIDSLNLNNNIKLLGLRKDIPDILLNSDVFILSSHYEGLPLTVLEAMAAKLPIISTNVGGVPDIVKVNGILVESGNVEKMKDAIISMASNEDLRKKMSEKSYEAVQEFDVKIAAKKHEEMYLGC